MRINNYVIHTQYWDFDDKSIEIDLLTKRRQFLHSMHLFNEPSSNREHFGRPLKWSSATIVNVALIVKELSLEI